MSNFAGSVTSEKNGAGGQKFENIIVSVGYLSVKASSRQPPQVKVSEGRVVLSNQNQIKSNQIGEKKGIWWFANCNVGAIAFTPNFGPGLLLSFQSSSAALLSKIP